MSLSEAMSGRPFSLNLTLGDLAAAPETWRQFSLSGSEDSVLLGRMMGTMGQTALGPYSLYFTQGKSFRSGDQTFLAAYHVEASQAELERMRRNLNRTGEQPEKVRLPSNTPLALSLLSTGSIGNINNVLPFDTSLVVPPLTPAQEKAEQAEVQGETSMSNLKQIGLGLLQYTQDYDEKFPPMQGATKAQLDVLRDQTAARTYDPTRKQTTQELIMPYVRNYQIFSQPGTNMPYQPNGSLSRRTLASIDHPNTLIAFYEAAPDAAGKRAVLFVDGHVQRISEKNWPQLRRASLITIRLSGAAALYYTYKTHQSAKSVTGATGKLYISVSTGRVYFRQPDGMVQWVAPPSSPIEVPYETGQYLGLSKYQGYNGAQKGKPFGGYGTGKTYTNAAP